MTMFSFSYISAHHAQLLWQGNGDDTQDLTIENGATVNRKHLNGLFLLCITVYNESRDNAEHWPTSSLALPLCSLQTRGEVMQRSGIINPTHDRSAQGKSIRAMVHTLGIARHTVRQSLWDRIAV